MSSIKTPPPKEVVASSSLEHDPALETAGANNGALAPAGSPSTPGTQASGDGALHLQNAHYGTLDVATPDSGSAGEGATGTNDIPPPPLTLDLTNHAHAPSWGPQTSTAFAGTLPGEGAPSGEEAHQGSEPATNSRFAPSQTFSFSTGGMPNPSAQPTKVDALSQTMAATQDENAAPTDISLSNTTIAENADGAVVGTLTTVDPDSGDTFTYTVSDDRFEVVAGQLKLKAGISLDHEGEPLVTISVTSTDNAGQSVTEDFTITVENVNEGPTDIALSNASIAENTAGAVIGTLTTVDPDAGDTHTYAVSDNRFEIVDGHLKLKDGVSLDHEAEPNVTVQVTATDAGGLSLNENFTITVANVNEGPTDIALSNALIAENAAGAVVGTLSTVDPDNGDMHSYAMSDNRFEVVDGQLKLKDGIALDHEAEPNVTIQVTSTDAGGLSISENFTITVENVNERPTGVTLSNAIVAENAAGAVIGTLATADPDVADSHTYATSDDRFEVVDGQLKLKAGVFLDYEAEQSVSIDVTATDAGGLSMTQTFTISVTDFSPIIMGTSRADVLVGTAENDRIFGLAGKDTIAAGAGDDLIVGGAGNDTLDGGEGSDTY